MSNYSKTTDFAAKDSLPSGDSGKIIRGSEFETEFDNISTAIATKADAADPTFTGTVTIDGLTVNGNTVLGNAATDTVTVTADIASNLLPSADDTYNLGAVGAEWNDLFIDGTANIDSLVADTADINGGTIDGVTIGGSSAGAITGTTITGTGFVTSGNMTFGDNDKAIFGAGSDLQIFHDGFNSYITDTGTGDLQIKGTQLSLKGANNDTYLYAIENGPLRLYYDNAEKLITTSTGVDVTGTVVADGLTSSGNLQIQKDTPAIELESPDGSSNSFKIIPSLNDTANFGTLFRVNDNTALKIDNNGDISFYEDTGTTAKFFWDASTERLGIGTSSPGSNLEVSSATGSASPTATELRITSSTQASDWSLTDPWGTLGFYSADTSGGGAGNLAEISANMENTVGGFASLDFTLQNPASSYAQTSWLKLNNSASLSQRRVDIEADGGLYVENNVGIGTTSPATTLHVQGSVQGGDQAIIESTNGGAASGPQLNLKRSSASPADNDPIGMLKFTGNNSALAEHEFARITAVMNDVTDTTEDGSLLFSTSSAGSISEAMRIDSSGNVGIGTSSPSNTLELQKNSNGHGITISQDNTSSGYHSVLRFNQSNGSGYTDTAKISAYGEANGANGSLRFYTNGNSEAMRIDSSGNLLVGKTSSTYNTAGTSLQSDGRSFFTADGSYSGAFNRKTSDGDIVLFSKNGSTVGNIGTFGGYVTVGKGDTGLIFRDTFDDITPFNVSTNSYQDATIDLGTSATRFKDLYLSGGAYLGGTAAANKLDDYEEGTWSPVYNTSGTGFTTMTMDVISAGYTKIGDTVIAHCFIRTDDVDTTGATGSVIVQGLPFTSSQNGSAIISYAVSWNQHPISGYVSGTSIFLQERNSSDGSTNSVDIADLINGTTANQNQLVLTAVYKTSA